MLSNFEIEGCQAAKRCFLKVGSETAVGTLSGRLLEVKMGGQDMRKWGLEASRRLPKSVWGAAGEAGRRRTPFFQNFKDFFEEISSGVR